MTDETPLQIAEFAARTVDQVRAILKVELGYDSETLPLVDYYLQTVPDHQSETVLLIAATTGAYFGEVVRRRLGGRWQLDAAAPTATAPMAARVILPWGLSFSPAGIVASAILSSDELDGLDTSFYVPGPLQDGLRSATERMSLVTDEEYYSLCGRLDTLEHLQEVALAIIETEKQKRLAN